MDSFRMGTYSMCFAFSCVSWHCTEGFRIWAPEPWPLAGRGAVLWASSCWEPSPGSRQNHLQSYFQPLIHGASWCRAGRASCVGAWCADVLWAWQEQLFQHISACMSSSPGLLACGRDRGGTSGDEVGEGYALEEKLSSLSHHSPRRSWWERQPVRGVYQKWQLLWVFPKPFLAQLSFQITMSFYTIFIPKSKWNKLLLSKFIDEIKPWRLCQHNSGSAELPQASERRSCLRKMSCLHAAPHRPPNPALRGVVFQLQSFIHLLLMLC